MTLQQILYGSFQPPQASRTYRHFIDGNPFVAKPNYRSEKRALIGDFVVPYLQKNPGSSVDEIAIGTKLSRKSIATAMVKLVNNGLVERAKRPRADGKMTVYAHWAR